MKSRRFAIFLQTCYNEFMKERIPCCINELAKACPFPLYVAGGAVRDCLAGLPEFADWDLAAPASTEEFIKAAERCRFTIQGVYKNTGTVNIARENIKIEFTAFRTDEYRRGEHTPSDVKFTDDIVQDAQRRDFKCNAVYYDVCGEQYIDPLGGIADIRDQRITTTRDADAVFSEDGLRLMRLARLAAQLGFTPDLPTIFGAKFNAALINKISAERIWAELCLLLHADEKYNIPYAQYNGFKVLDGTDVLKYILPELAPGKNMPQRADFHDHDVLEHSLRAVKYADQSIRLAALLHDVGKPFCYMNSGRYYRHEIEGARIAQSILERWKAPKKIAEETVRLVRTHMYDLNNKTRENKIRAFIVENYDIYPSILLLKQADYSACKDDLSICPTVRRWTEIYKKMEAAGAPFTLKQLKINGNDLKGNVFEKNTGKILHTLLLQCAKNPALNRKDYLIQEAKRLDIWGDKQND